MANLWFITVPEATTNYCLNPSAETTSNFAAHNSATVTRDTTYARQGVYSYKIVPGGVDRGINLTLSTFPNAAAYISFYVRGTITGNLNVSMDAGVNYSTSAIIGGMTGGWVRYGFALSSTYANASTSLIIRNTVSETFYIDAIQVEAKGYPTTYCDGSLPGLYRWSGLYHGSTSSRDAQERRGGKEVDLEATYGVTVRMPSSGLGMPPVVNNLQDMSLQPGSIYQSYTVLPNALDLAMTFPGTSQSNLHTLRQYIIDLVKPDGARGAQPFIIGYAGAGVYKKVYNEFYYADGLPYGDVTRTVEQPNIHIVSVNPYWYEDNQGTAALDYQDTFTAARGAVRSNGDWGSLGTGFNSGAVYAIAEDKQNGRIWFGGSFNTANGVTVNGLTYWNGTTFVAVGSTPGVSGSFATVYCLAVAPNGDVWFGGDFTSAGGSTSDGVGYYDTSAGAIVQVTNGTAGDIIYSIAIKSTGVVYISGSFTNWDAIAAADYIASYDGSAWAAVGTPSLGANNFPAVHKAMLVDSNDVLWIGTFGTSGGNLYKVDGTTWTTIATATGSNADLYGMSFSKSGELFITGSFTTITPSGGSAVTATNIVVYNGSSFSALGSGISGGTIVYAVDTLDGNSIIVGGNMTTAGGITVTGLALWNGYTWSAPDISYTTLYRSVLVSRNRDIYVVGGDSATATVAGLTSITPTSTATTFPVITVINGNTSGSCTLQWIENQSAGQTLFFNLVIQAGETITIDFRTGQKRVTSDWRGEIYGQPLDNSDFGAFALLPARPDDAVPNVIAMLITGTVTTVTAVANWTPRHWSGDGAAAA